MKSHIVSRIITTLLLVAVAAAISVIAISTWRNSASPSSKNVTRSENLVVHEWGTFTSIAGKDGVALEWRPLNGASDLPKFVHTIQTVNDGLRHAPPKAQLTAAIRMETPVLYFYSPNDTEVSVKVDFPKGKITEWYPQARSVNTTIDWGRLKVTPGAAVNLPVDYSSSHYFAARETDAAPVQVCATNGKPAQQEKFLFYRGVGTFDLPLSVKLEGQNILLRTNDVISHAIIFENRGGKVGFRSIDNLAGEMVIERLTLDKNTDSVIQDLRQALVSSGLYEKEAEAMIKTWRDSWFEKGARVFYILPRQTTDAVLPITIDPRPSDLVRVLVGRAEIITPEMEDSVKQQVSLVSDPSAKVRDEAARAIRKYGRFSEPILKDILRDEKDATIRERIKRLIETPAGV